MFNCKCWSIYTLKHGSEHQESSWSQLWQQETAVPPVLKKLASWWLSVFLVSRCPICALPSTGKIPFNSLTPGRFVWNFIQVIFKIISVVDGWGISCETAVRWMSLFHSDDKSTLVQVMAWCPQATSHYLSQCWPRSMSPYGVTRPQWVKRSQISLSSKCHWPLKITNTVLLTSPLNMADEISVARYRGSWGVK